MITSEGLKDLTFEDLVLLAKIMEDRVGDEAREIRRAIRQEVYRRDYNL